MAVGSRAMDRMNRVRPPTGPYGPWTVARWTGTPSSGPVHGPGVVRVAVPAVYGQINVYGVTTKSERHKRSYWTRTADGNGIGGRKAPVPYGS